MVILAALASLALACSPGSDGETEDAGTSGSGETETTEASETDTSGSETDPAGSETGAGAGPYSSCGEGGATSGEWTRYDVDLSWYEVLAPPAGDEPFPLVIALHGDEGSPGAVKFDWGMTWMAHQDFVVATPQLHTQDGQEPSNENGWDNHPDDGATLVLQVLEDVGDRYDIDINRVYLTGVSAGSWFIGQRAYTLQQYFAAIQLSCGASPLEWGAYSLPENDACKAPTRFEVATDDFLFEYAKTLEGELLAQGHEVEFSESACSGHCCGSPDMYGEAALQFFLSHTLCGDTLVGEPGGTCGEFSDIPLP